MNTSRSMEVQRGKMYKIAVVPGDGVGPEVTKATLHVLKSLGLDFEFAIFNLGLEYWKESGKQISDEDIEAIRKTDACLKGPTTTPPGPGVFRSVAVTLRQKLDLYANVRPVKSRLGVKSLHSNVDIIIVRENTEGMYKGLEFRVDGSALGVRVITSQGSNRIAHFAFELARLQKRRKVTIVHKANILKETCGLFRETCFNVATQYPEIKADELIIDAAAMKLVMEPQELDVILTTNLFGDILSDEAAGLVGGLGLIPSANIGEHFAVFEPVHGSAPQISGKGIANPSAMMLSAAMMLRYLNIPEYASRLENAIDRVLEEGTALTFDLGGSASTMDMADAVVTQVSKL